MANPTPDLNTIQQRMESDINHYIPGAELRPRFSVLTVVTKAYAAAVHSLYQYTWGLLRNILPSTCDDDWLPAWAYVLNVTRRQAIAATGVGVFSGTGTIPAGTELQDTEGRLFTTSAAVASGEIVSITAAEAGIAGNISTTTLTLKHPISGISNDFSVSSALAGGYDIESLAEWRERIVEKFSTRQKIGDADDHITLVKDIDPTIKYVWVYGNTPALGQITIVCALAGANPAPSASQLASLKAELERKRNVGAELILSAPSFIAVPFELANVEISAQADITAAIVELFNSLRNEGATLYISDIHATIRQVYGGIYSLKTPTSDITAPAQTLLTMGATSWV